VLFRSVLLVFEPGMDLLPLFVEALALLPPSRRWEVDFSTHFTHLPQGLSCVWRGLLSGSPEARQALRLPNILLIQLDKPKGIASGADLVHLARTGQRLERPAEGRRQGGREVPESRASTPAHTRPDLGPSPEFLVRTNQSPFAYDLIPGQPQSSTTTQARSAIGRTVSGGTRSRKGLIITAIAASIIVTTVSLAWLTGFVSVSGALGLNKRLSQEIADKREEVRKRRAVAENEKPQEPLQGNEETVVLQKEIEAAPPAKSSGRQSEEERKEDTKGEKIIAKEIVPPQPKAVPTFPGEVPVRFMRLPNFGSGLGGSKELDTVHHFPSTINDISIVFPTEELRMRTEASPGIYEIEQASESDFGKKSIGTFVRNDNTLIFKWNEAARLQLVEVLRDSVLRVDTRDGLLFVILRDSPAGTDAAIPLIEAGRKVTAGDYTTRTLSRTWTKSDQATQELMANTKWKLCLRQWRIDVANSTLAEGTNQDLSDNIIAQLVSDNEALLRITLEKERLNVRLEFDTSKIYENDRTLKDLTDEWKRLSAKKGRANVEEKQKIDERLAEIQTESEPIKQRQAMLERINSATSADLNLSIGLIVDKATVIDFARFGKFAKPNR